MLRNFTIRTAFAALLFAGCGTDGNSDDPATNNGSAGDAGLGDATTGPDAGHDDAGSSPDSSAPDSGDGVDLPTPDFGMSIYPILEDEEPNSQRSDATPFTAPATLQGTVERENDAVDWWEVNVGGPSILEITIEGGDVGWVEVQTTDVAKRGVFGSEGTMREFFVPAPNRYQIGIVATQENPSYAYSITVRSIDASPEPLEGLTASGDLDDGRVDVYSWVSSGEGFTIAEIFGVRDPVASELDSFLFVQDQTLGTFESNDDASSGGTNDSRLDFERRDGAEYWIAVDMYEPTDDRRYELRLQTN